jgi:hypothetical protein
MVLDTHLQPCIPVETVSPPLCDMPPGRSYNLIIGAIDKGCQVKLVLEEFSQNPKDLPLFFRFIWTGTFLIGPIERASHDHGKVDWQIRS